MALMFRQAGLLCAALAMFSIAGGHWAVLQSVAWVQMLGDYSQRTGSVAVAVTETFDGQHPCELCRQIQAAKANEHKGGKPMAAAGKEDARVKALLATVNPALPARTAIKIVFARTASLSGLSRNDPPPTPPPRRGSLAA